jgi:hypothetical protein
MRLSSQLAFYLVNLRKLKAPKLQKSRPLRS